MTAIKIAPSILAADFARLGEQVREAERAGADYLHIDPMDGHFVPNITFGPLVLEAVHRNTSIPLDVHMMVAEPDRHIGFFKDAGASILTVHAEACVHLHRTIQSIKAAGLRAGVALNPATPIEQVRWILPELDLLLIMSINPGWGGQRFLPLALEKLRAAKALIDELGLSTELEVDGGVDERTAPAAVAAGATVLVAGSAVFGHAEGIEAGIKALRAAVGGG